MEMLFALLLVIGFSTCSQNKSASEAPVPVTPHYSAVYNFPPNDLQPGEGSKTVTATSIEKCMTSDGQEVEKSFCESAPFPQRTYLSPPGRRPIAIEGAEVSEEAVAEGDTTWVFDPNTLVCQAERVKRDGACLVPTFSSIYSDYSLPTKINPCDGQETLTRSFVSCRNDLTEELADAAKCASNVDPAPTKLHVSPAGEKIVSVTEGTKTFACAPGDTIDSANLIDVTCTETGKHKSGLQCVADTFTAQFKDPGTTKAEACSGTEIISQVMDSCVRDHDGLSVIHAFCADKPVPTITHRSPEGNKTISDSEGTKTYSCGPGDELAQGTLIDITCTETGKHKSGLACVEDTYTAQFSDPGNSKTEACSGTETIPQVLDKCLRDHDAAEMDLALCSSKPVPDVTHKSPEGQKTIDVADGTETYQCAEGQELAQGTLIDVTCTTEGEHKSGLQCVADTFTASFIDPGNSKTEICSGTETVDPVMNECKRDHDGLVASLDKCQSQTASPIVHNSPEGNLTISVPEGTQTFHCLAGKTISESTLIDVTCTETAKHKQELTCVADTYTALFKDPGNSKTESCSGTETVSQVLDKCLRDHDQSEMDASYCASQAVPTVTHKSPAGTKVIDVAQGTETYQCLEGQQLVDGTLIDVTCSQTDFHKEGLTCVSDTYTAGFSDLTNTKTETCSGTETVQGTLTSCTRDHDAQGMDLSYCASHTVPSYTHESPAGEKTIAVEDGTETYQCDLGESLAQGTLVDITCSKPDFHKSGLQCVADTFTAQFQDPGNNVTAVCSGIETVDAVMNDCIRDHDQVSVALDKCAGQAGYSITHTSPSGSRNIVIDNATGPATENCAAGSTTWVLDTESFSCQTSPTEFVKVGGSCVQRFIACTSTEADPIFALTGLREYNGSDYGACVATSCFDGYYLNSNTCVEVGVGYYSDSISHIARNQCPIHSSTVGDKSTSIADCLADAGYFKDANGVFEEVGLGYFSPALSNDQLACLAGTYSDIMTAETCKTCTNQPEHSTSVEYSMFDSALQSNACTYASITCESGFDLVGDTCVQSVPDTYTPVYSDYTPAQNDVQICDGPVIATRTMTCKRDRDGATVDNQYCPADPLPETTYLSPGGVKFTEAVNHGTRYKGCDEGSATLYTMDVICDSGYFRGGSVCFKNPQLLFSDKKEFMFSADLFAKSGNYFYYARQNGSWTNIVVSDGSTKVGDYQICPSTGNPQYTMAWMVNGSGGFSFPTNCTSSRKRAMYLFNGPSMVSTPEISGSYNFPIAPHSGGFLYSSYNGSATQFTFTNGYGFSSPNAFATYQFNPGDASQTFSSQYIRTMSDNKILMLARSPSGVEPFIYNPMLPTSVANPVMIKDLIPGTTGVLPTNTTYTDYRGSAIASEDKRVVGFEYTDPNTLNGYFVIYNDQLPISSSNPYVHLLKTKAGNNQSYQQNAQLTTVINNRFVIFTEAGATGGLEFYKFDALNMTAPTVVATKARYLGKTASHIYLYDFNVAAIVKYPMDGSASTNIPVPSGFTSVVGSAIELNTPDFLVFAVYDAASNHKLYRLSFNNDSITQIGTSKTVQGINSFTINGDHLLFMTENYGVNGYGLQVTDGTAAGTVKVVDGLSSELSQYASTTLINPDRETFNDYTFNDSNTYTRNLFQIGTKLFFSVGANIYVIETNPP